MGPGPVNTNLGTGSVNTNWGPGLEARAVGQAKGQGPENTNTHHFNVKSRFNLVFDRFKTKSSVFSGYFLRFNAIVRSFFLKTVAACLFHLLLTSLYLKFRHLSTYY